MDISKHNRVVTIERGSVGRSALADVAFTGTCLAAMFAAELGARGETPAPPVTGAAVVAVNNAEEEGQQTKQYAPMTLDLSPVGFDKEATVVWSNPADIERQTQWVRNSVPRDDELAPLPDNYIRAHFRLMRLEDAVRPTDPGLADALFELRGRALTMVQAPPAEKEKCFKPFLEQRRHIAEKFGLLANINVALEDGEGMHQFAALPIHGKLQVHRDGKSSTVLFVSEALVPAEGFTVRDLAVVNLANLDPETMGSSNALRTVLVDELAHMYLSQHLNFDAYYDLPWDTNNDGRPDAPPLFVTDEHREAIKTLPVRTHQHVDELVSFGWGLTVDNKLGIDAAVGSVLMFDGQTLSPQAFDDRYFLVNRLVGLALEAINAKRGGALQLAERFRVIAEHQEAAGDTYVTLRKSQGIRLSCEIMGRNIPNGVVPVREKLLSEFPDPVRAPELLAATIKNLSDDDQKAARTLLEEYAGLCQRYAQYGVTVDDMRLMHTAEFADQALKEVDRTKAAWRAELIQQRKSLFESLTPEDRAQIAEVVLRYSQHYEAKIQQYYQSQPPKDQP